MPDVLINNWPEQCSIIDGNVVLDSWLVPFHSDDNWKWIHHFPCVLQTTAPHQNQRVCRFTCSGRFRCWDERYPVLVHLWCYRNLHVASGWLVMGRFDEMVVRIRFRDELVQFSLGPLYCSCEAFKVLNFYESSSRQPNTFRFLGNASCFKDQSTSTLRDFVRLTY